MSLGEFDRWRRAVFQRRERTAERAMAVARWLGTKSDKMSDFPFGVAAAYSLVSHEIPEASREEALALAAAGEPITAAIADAIITRRQQHGGLRAEPMLAEQLAPRVLRVIERYEHQLSKIEFIRLGRLLQKHFERRGLRIAK
jgi:hypothetical protein